MLPSSQRPSSFHYALHFEQITNYDLRGIIVLDCLSWSGVADCGAVDAWDA